MKKHNFGSVSLTLILILLAGIGAILYFGYLFACSIDLCDARGNLSRNKTALRQAPTNPETGWSIFTDEKTGFTFEYPSDYKLEVMPSNTPNLITSVSVKNEQSSETYKMAEYFSMTIELYNAYVTPAGAIDVYIAKPICDTENELSMSAKGKSIDELVCRSKVSSSFKPFKSGNIPGTSAPYFLFESSAIYYAFDMDRYFVKVTQWGAEGTDPGEIPIETLKEIISTFKFIQ